jgi:hypothetical protein
MAIFVQTFYWPAAKVIVCCVRLIRTNFCMTGSPVCSAAWLLIADAINSISGSKRILALHAWQIIVSIYAIPRLIESNANQIYKLIKMYKYKYVCEDSTLTKNEIHNRRRRNMGNPNTTKSKREILKHGWITKKPNHTPRGDNINVSMWKFRM